MPKAPGPETRSSSAPRRRTSTSPATPKLARGTRDALAPMTLDDAEAIVDDSSFELAAEPEHTDEAHDLHADSADVVDARMLELGQRRFNISQFRPGQALAIRNVIAGID